MRSVCEQIVREISAPSSGSPSLQAAEHLRDCPSCSAWAREVKAFDQLWRETALPEPTVEAWSQAWSETVRQAGRPSSSFLTLGASSDPNPRQRGRIAAVWVGLAAAAALALVIGGSLLPRQQDGFDPNAIANRSSEATSPDRSAQPLVLTPVSLNLDEGEIGFIRLSLNGKPELRAREIDDNSGQIGEDLALLSYFEGISQ